MTSRRWDLLVIGDCGVDIYVAVPRLPAYDEKVPADLLGMYGGGVAANFACAAQRFGRRVGLLASVGQDPFAALAVRTVEDFGVDVGPIRRMADVPTAFCFVALDGTGEKALTIVRTPTFFPTLDQIDPELVGEASVVHMAPFDIGVAAQVAREASRRGAQVTVDLEPGMLAAGDDALQDLLRQTTLAMPNQQFLTARFPDRSPADAARALRSLGPEAVVATLGSEGAVVATGAGETHVAAVPTRVEDTTGAGDCFNAVLVSAWLEGTDLVEAARWGAAAASIAITAQGARSRLPTRAEVLAVAARARGGTDA
ncbi:MAG: carbohydrate kinase family protein [Actinomycetota bacterium]|nr:carbohydrate kinase family protein [Actinomycetota bacterium]